MLPALDVLVGVFYHHHRRIDHRADGDRNAAQRHDIGVDPLVTHDDERGQYADRQSDDRDQRRAQVKQEQRADEGDDDEFLDELPSQIVDCALDKLRAIVGRHDFNTRRQARLQGFQFCFHGGNGFQRVFAGAHDDDAARHLALAIEFRDATAHFRAHLHARDVPQSHRDAGIGRRQRNFAKVVERLQVAGGAHHVLGFTQFQHRAAGFLVRFLHGFDNFPVGNVVGAQLVGVEHDLVLPHHAANAGDFRHVRHRLQFVLEEPVLQGA